MAETEFNNQPMNPDDHRTDRADALSMRMYHLQNVVHLASFAAETRRALEGIENAMHFRPEMQQAIGEHVKCVNSWMDRKDVAGDVLEWVAMQMDEVNNEMTEYMYEICRCKPAAQGKAIAQPSAAA